MSTDIRDYLAEAEALVHEWYGRDGLEGTHERNIDRLAALLVVNVVMGSERAFGELTAAARLYLIAAFQMGRAAACGGGDE